VTTAQASISRMPPHSEEAERSLLGAVLLEGDTLTEVMTLLSPEDFYVTAHQKIYASCEKLYGDGKRVDSTLILEDLRSNGELEKVGGEAYLAHLAALVPSAAGAVDYARIVSDKSVLRGLIHTCTEIQTNAYSGSVPGDELLDWAEGQVFSLSRGAAAQETHDIRSVLTDTFEEINALMEGGGVGAGTPTGYFELDERTSGLGKGDLVIVAGRPSMGKTTFANCLVDHIGVVEKVPIVYFSLEVSRQHLVRNMLCSRARVELQHVRRGTIGNEEVDRLTRAAGELMEAQIFIDDTAGANILGIRAKARRIKQKHGLGLVVVDYLQLMETGRGENRQQEIALISRQLKAMAREMDCPVIALSQLNRSVDNREDRRPRMSDLRESGALEQDADLIMFLYREYQYKPSEENRNQAEVIIAKQRNGPTGVVPLHFYGHFLRFDNPTLGGEDGF